ncbi:P-loop containing nucleoside triphosphate hydrolase protein [Catenaria anguillulae PL171]|uniref:p-loop containing nucleoside triphosphate hydrolase protein n=1 Tax=Catenaria anguillulae PL171 TaxID=765915 RepID=A0A1Y2HZB0_9FUNG|nr:P-loop containing nucleoside triphosphate hydrolase protein [Catenaria anguillulae PL171]
MTKHYFRKRMSLTEPPENAKHLNPNDSEYSAKLASHLKATSGLPPIEERDYRKPVDYIDQLLKWKRDPLALYGQPIRPFPRLQKSLLGIRPGELTVLTGNTGTGKTTFLSQLALFMAHADGFRSLFGSFEVANDVMVRRMVVQLSGRPFLELSDDECKGYLHELDAVPVFFMPFFGSTSTEHVLQMMGKMVDDEKIQMIVLDNLQFFLSGQGRSSLDQLYQQELAIHRIRAFATKHKVHVMLVVHPRKPPSDPRAAGRTLLTVDSIAGSAKITQEADNVLLLQRVNWGATRLDVAKNRFNGTMGKSWMRFDQSSLRVPTIDSPAHFVVRTIAKMIWRAAHIVCCLHHPRLVYRVCSG